MKKLFASVLWAVGFVPLSLQKTNGGPGGWGAGCGAPSLRPSVFRGLGREVLQSLSRLGVEV